MVEKRLRVLVGKPGMDGHDKGARTIALAFRDAGFEVVYTGVQQSPEQIVSAALQEDADLVALSILSGSHNTLLPSVSQLLREKKADDIVLLAGGVIPEADIPDLKRAGVGEVFTPGTPVGAIVAWVKEHVATRPALSLAERVLDGDLRAAARLMRELDERLPSAIDDLKTLYPHTGNAYLLGITGPSGVGKSTLVDRIVAQFRKQELLVGVIAVDPSSPLSGGAILGDRIRMASHGDDAGVFIKSLATRGAPGGLSRSTSGVVDVMDAMGMDVVIIETVGAGVDETAIAGAAHTVAAVTAPGLGDDVQDLKAGIPETADLFIVNKAVRDGADRTARELQSMLELRQAEGGWARRVLKTDASSGLGIEELVAACEAHRAYLKVSGTLERISRERRLRIFENLLREQLWERDFNDLHEDQRCRQTLEELRSGSIDPYRALDRVREEGAFS